jgi:hypothetical protein
MRICHFVLFLGLAISVTCARSQSPALPDVSFKGIPFGTSQADFKREFPGVECSQLDASVTTCKGKTDFFKRQADFTVFFSGKGMYLAYARIYASDMDALFEQAMESMLERFKVFTEARLGSFLHWDIGGKNEQGASLMKCNGTERCLRQDEPGIMVYLLDGRFSAKKPDF